MSTTAPAWIYVIARFQAFLENLDLTDDQVTDGQTKAKGVIGCLNRAYWNSHSDLEHAFAIGSWAKLTRIRPPRDVDIYFQLPKTVYDRLEGYAPGTNKQSTLLQEVKGTLLATYPNSSIKGDGPIVLVGFASYSVEVVPTFLYSETDQSYAVSDTKNGGSYKITKPNAEVQNIDGADQRNNQNVRRLVRMLKCWQAVCAVPIKSFHLELLAIEFLDQWQYRLQSFFYFDWMIRDFFRWLTSKANSFVFTPGTYDIMLLGDAWKTKAESAHARAVKAADFERDNDMANAGDEWQKIFGYYIPRNL